MKIGPANPLLLTKTSIQVYWKKGEERGSCVFISLWTRPQGEKVTDHSCYLTISYNLICLREAPKFNLYFKCSKSVLYLCSHYINYHDYMFCSTLHYNNRSSKRGLLWFWIFLSNKLKMDIFNEMTTNKFYVLKFIFEQNVF